MPRSKGDISAQLYAGRSRPPAAAAKNSEAGGGRTSSPASSSRSDDARAQHHGGHLSAATGEERTVGGPRTPPASAPLGKDVRAQTLSRDDAALLLGVLDAMCNRYRGGKDVPPEALEIIQRIANVIYEQPATYLPAFFMCLDQARYNAGRRGAKR